MNDADADANAIAAPTKHPRIAGGRDLVAYQEHCFPLIAMRGMEIVLRADAEAPESGIEAGLLEQRGPVAARVDQDAAAESFGSSTDACHGVAFEHGRDDGRREPDACSRGNRELAQILEHAAHVDHAHRRHAVIEDGGVCGGEKANARDRVVEARRNPQRVHFVDEASAAGADGRSDLVILLEHEHGTATSCQSLGGGEPRGPGAGDNGFKHPLSGYFRSPRDCELKFAAARTPETHSTTWKRLRCSACGAGCHPGCHPAPHSLPPAAESFAACATHPRRGLVAARVRTPITPR